MKRTCECRSVLKAEWQAAVPFLECAKLLTRIRLGPLLQACLLTCRNFSVQKTSTMTNGDTPLGLCISLYMLAYYARGKKNSAEGGAIAPPENGGWGGVKTQTQPPKIETQERAGEWLCPRAGRGLPQVCF